MHPVKARPKDLAKMFKALSNANRLRLFMEILDSKQSEFDEAHACFLNVIMERLDIGAPTISHHLKELVNAELITTDRRGKYVTCKVNPKAVARLATFFDRS